MVVHGERDVEKRGIVRERRAVRQRRRVERTFRGTILMQAQTCTHAHTHTHTHTQFGNITPHGSNHMFTQPGPITVN